METNRHHAAFKIKFPPCQPPNDATNRSTKQLLIILYNFNILDPIKEYLDENLKTVFIPKYLHEQFQCSVGTHVFINNPWKKVSRKKIIEHLQLEKTNSCFWEFRKQIEVKKFIEVFLIYTK